VHVSRCVFWLRFLWLGFFCVRFFLWLRRIWCLLYLDSGEEGEDSTGNGDTEGGEGIAVFWRFAWVLVLLELFLFAWLDWGASAVTPLVFTDVPVC